MIDPYQKYKQQSILTSDGGKLIIMLFSGLIKFIKVAKISIEKKNIQDANSSIIKAQDILIELMTSLDDNYEISNNLIKIYDYMYNRLVEANIKKSTDILQEVLGMSCDLRDTWNQAVKMYSSKN